MLSRTRVAPRRDASPVAGRRPERGYADAVNRTDRLLAIVLELQGRRRATADHLARTFEVSTRTIYRDIQALGEAGVPIVSAPGQGYWLMEGYFLPPVHFTTEEATLLLLGSEVMVQSFDAHYRSAAQSAGRKIEGVLPDDLRREVRYLVDNIRFVELAGAERARHHPKLSALRGAIIDRFTVTFGYVKRNGERSVRTVDPHGLFHLDGVWMLSAFCHDRQAFRAFRLSRMGEPTVTARRFERQSAVTERDSRDGDRRDLVVRALFTPEAARWLGERPSYFTVERRDGDEGSLLTLAARSVDDLLPWLLGWGAEVTVLSPAVVRDRLREEAVALAERYAQDP